MLAQFDGTEHLCGLAIARPRYCCCRSKRSASWHQTLCEPSTASIIGSHLLKKINEKSASRQYPSGLKTKKARIGNRYSSPCIYRWPGGSYPPLWHPVVVVLGGEYLPGKERRLPKSGQHGKDRAEAITVILHKISQYLAGLFSTPFLEIFSRLRSGKGAEVAGRSRSDAHATSRCVMYRPAR